jgi:ferrous iron transport protein B
MSECHTTPAPVKPRFTPDAVDTPLIALAGQPNMGKSTLFNLLTGLNQHVGNWPGKTVERREGDFSLQGRTCHLVDLPGTYSLTANSPEEVIAREFILRESPSLVVALVSAANLERSLYLVSELVALPTPLVVAVNMMDVADQEGIEVEVEVLEAALGVPVAAITATRAAGVKHLLQVIQETLDGQRICMPRQPEIRPDHQAALREVRHLINGSVPAPYPSDWTALKLLEGDAEMTRRMQAALPADAWGAVHGVLLQHDDAFLAVASGRYEWIGRMVRAAVATPRVGQVSLTERLDRWAAHPVWGLFILGGILGMVFWLTFAIGTPMQSWLDTTLVHGTAGMLSRLLAGAPGWLVSLVVDGALGGAGTVITFLPILVIFFATFAVLEDVGYMARAAYVMDNLMHLMGLHGKSFLPLFLGFGCNVPAIMGTRVIDSRQARMLTILIAPLVPCTARMAVVAILAPAFFGRNALYVTWGLVLFSMVALVLSGMVLNRTIFRGQRSAFIMEMPLYHLPNARSIGLLVWQRTTSFIQKAGTVILAMAMVVWALSTLPNGDLPTSFLARFGQLLEPIGRWMGLDWRLTVALITSFPAKENAIATLSVLFGSAAQGGGLEAPGGLAGTLAATFSIATAAAFLTVSLLFIPCMATVAVIRQESGSWHWALADMGFFLVLSIAAGSLVFQGLHYIGY